uniref:Uncharacterized protein LOC104266741 n=1 Tax=Phallusia mammillata TaxID=59560 RepID=A0A6F9DIF3_9ASCI|nr:uncharacterized protein LOC104266741 [Phallusia mammillata]
MSLKSTTKNKGATTITCMLRRREIYANFSKYPIKRSQLAVGPTFSRLPSRLAFCLKDIVSESILMDQAHVFLGFSKNGTFVISYTEIYEPSDHTGFITLVYRLHWWLFRQDKKMVKVRTVRLFANEEISGRLCITYAEWPKDRSKIVVTGYGKQTNICYITVAAVPAFSPCEDCGFGNQHTDELCEETDDLSTSNCLSHGFVAHMKHTSVSSNSTVLNACGLKIDDLLVLNMGHSIGVFSLGILPTNGNTTSLPLSSIKRATFEDIPVPCNNEEIKPMANSDRTFDLLLTRHLNLVSSGVQRGSDNGSVHNADFSGSSTPYTSDFSSSIQMETDLFSPSNSQVDEPIRSPTQGSLFSFTSDDSLPTSQRIVLSENNSSNARCKQCCNIMIASNGTTVADDTVDPYFDPEPKSIVLVSQRSNNVNQLSGTQFKNENCCCGLATNANCSAHENTCASYKAEQNNCVYCGRNIPENHELTGKRKRTDSFSLTNITPPNRSTSKVLKLSSFRSQMEVSMESVTSPSPNASESSGTGSVYCNGDVSSHGNLRPVCRSTDGIVSFLETLYGPTMGTAEEPVPFAENSLFCGPVTIQGGNGMILNPVKDESSKKSVAFSQNLVLDVEHVIFDVLRTRCYTTYKFGYLIDYDVQIIDVCPSTRSVILLIVALLNVSPQKSKTKLREMHFRHHSNFGSKANALQQFQCFLCWRLQTGRYEVVAASPLQAYSEKMGSKWNACWAVETVKEIRKSCAVPRCAQSSVYALSNLSVLQGKSLNLLWDANRMVALRK